MTLELPHHNRYEYSPLAERKDYSWPGGKRLAFCSDDQSVVHAFMQGAGTTTPNTANRSPAQLPWRDYGNRIGIWRLFRSGR